MRISVLMPVYATPLPWVKEAVQSIIDQDHRDFDFIIVDDNNEKGELTQYLYSLSEKNCCISIVRTSENKGIASALDFGLQFCKGDLIVRMDADDIAYPNLLSVHDDFFTKNPQCHICGIQILLDNGQQTWHSKHPPIVTRSLAAYMDGTWFVNHPGVAYRREAIAFVGGYGPTPSYLAEDYALWIKFLLAGYDIYNHQEILMHYRVHPKSFSFAPDRKAAVWHEFLKTQKQLLR